MSCETGRIGIWASLSRTPRWGSRNNLGLAFFFPLAHAGIDWAKEPEFVDKELQKIAPESKEGQGTVDKLAKVWRHDGEEAWVYVHIEVQSQHETTFGRRMYTYNHRLEDRYGRMPVTLAVLGDDGPKWRPSSHSADLWGCAVQFTFPVAKLLDYKDREDALETDLNPFAAVVLAHLKTLQTRGDIPGRQRWKLHLVKGLYKRGWAKEQVLRLFRLIDWMMALPPVPQAAFVADVTQFEEGEKMPFISPTEQLWLDKGIAKGWAEGRAEGRTEGIVEGLIRGIEIGLEVRFGEAGLELMPRLQTVNDVAVLESFLRAIKDAPTLDALQRLLPPENPQ